MIKTNYFYFYSHRSQMNFIETASSSQILSKMRVLEKDLRNTTKAVSAILTCLETLKKNEDLGEDSLYAFMYRNAAKYTAEMQKKQRKFPRREYACVGMPPVTHLLDRQFVYDHEHMANDDSDLSYVLRALSEIEPVYDVNADVTEMTMVEVARHTPCKEGSALALALKTLLFSEADENIKERDAFYREMSKAFTIESRLGADAVQAYEKTIRDAALAAVRGSAAAAVAAGAKRKRSSRSAK